MNAIVRAELPGRSGRRSARSAPSAARSAMASPVGTRNLTGYRKSPPTDQSSPATPRGETVRAKESNRKRRCLARKRRVRIDSGPSGRREIADDAARQRTVMPKNTDSRKWKTLVLESDPQ